VPIADFNPESVRGCFPALLIQFSERLRVANAQQIANPTNAPQMSIITSIGDAVRDGTNDW